MASQELGAMVANVGQVQNEIARQSVLDRERPGLDVRCNQIRVDRNDWTTTSGSAGRGGSIPDQNNGAAIVNGRCRIHTSIRWAVPLYGSQRSVRPAPTHLTHVTRAAR